MGEHDTTTTTHTTTNNTNYTTTYSGNYRCDYKSNSTGEGAITDRFAGYRQTGDIPVAGTWS
jgi:hypothetical protein